MRMRRVDGHLPWMSSWSECCYGYFDPLKPFNYLGKNRLIVNSDSLVDIIFVNNFRFHFPKLIILTMNLCVYQIITSFVHTVLYKYNN